MRGDGPHELLTVHANRTNKAERRNTGGLIGAGSPQKALWEENPENPNEEHREKQKMEGGNPARVSVSCLDLTATQLNSFRDPPRTHLREALGKHPWLPPVPENYLGCKLAAIGGVL